jgi:hypothetical protein
MMNRHTVLVLAIPLAAAGLLLLAAVLRKPVEPQPEGKVRKVATTREFVADRPLPKVAPAHAMVRVTDDARVRSTYHQFRTSVATDNSVLQDALRPVLLRDRDFAARLAQEEISTASTDADRTIARKTLEALRN